MILECLSDDRVGACLEAEISDDQVSVIKHNIDIDSSVNNK